MQNLKYNQLLVLSNTAKSANRFLFKKHLNLITANDNSVGKSTVAKLLFWGFGCEPSFDTTWQAFDCSTIIDFTIGKNNYHLKRYKDIIALKENDLPFTEYKKITGEYAEKIAEILQFKALLPNRSSGLLETPPPAFYFLPFYIDQKRSWSKAWDNFERLEQYEKWKSTIINYHIGLLNATHFEIEIEKGEKKLLKKTVNIEVEKITTALDVLDNYIPKYNLTAVSEEKLIHLTNEIEKDLIDLQRKQEMFLNQYSISQTDKVYLEQQRDLSEKILYELDKDYVFSIENLEGEEIECPLCGTVHENSVVNRTSILTDKIQAENQLQTINSEITKIETKLLKLEQELIEVREGISEINDKYVLIDDEVTLEFPNIIESISATNIKKTATADKNEKAIKVTDLTKEINALTKEQKGLLTKETIEDSNYNFNSIFSNYVKFLDAQAVNLSSIKTPLDYSKIIKEGGAAEGTRAILSYYLTIFSMVSKFGNEVMAPLVIDTPNQQEQSYTNYEKIVDFLISKIDDNNQIILCAMENDQLKPFSKIANIIVLDDNKILLPEKYIEVKSEFEKL